MRGRTLPHSSTRINIRVFSSDWDWINQHKPGEANEILRSLLAAYVRHQQAQASKR